MRKGILCLLMLCIVFTLGAQGTKDQKTDQVTLRFMWWGGDARHKATLQVIDQYMSIHPNVKIEAEYGGYDGYFEKLTAQLAGGTAADIMQFDASMTVDLLRIGDVFVDLKKVKNLDVSDFDSQFLENYSMYNNALVGLPTGINAGNLMINSAVTDKAGIVLPQKYTWDGLIEDAKKLHAYDANKYFINYDITTLGKEFIFSTLAQLTGKEILSADKKLAFSRDDLYKVFSLIDAMYKNHVLEPAAISAPFEAKINTNPKWANHDFAGTFGVTSLVTGSYYDWKDTAVVMPWPEFPNAKENGIMLRPAQLIGIASSSKHAEVAADFLNYFFNNKEAALALKDVRSIPATNMARDVCQQANLLDPVNVKTVNMALEIGTKNQNLSVPNELVQILKDATGKIAYGQGTVAQITDTTIRLLNETLARL